MIGISATQYTRSLLLGVLLLTLCSEQGTSQTEWQRIGSCAFRGIQRLPSGRLVMVTDGGGMYSSTDNGATWSYDTIDPSLLLTSVSFFDNNVGMVGGVATGSGAVGVTTDGGHTWKMQRSPDLRALLSVSAPSHDTLYAACALGAGALFRSLDAGVTWSQLTLNTKDYLLRVRFTSARTGYVTGDTGLLAVTSNAGEGWQTIETGLTRAVTACDWNGSRIALCSTDADNEGVIALSRDSGRTWRYSRFSDSLSGGIGVIKFVSGDTLVAFPSNNFFRFTSTDFGVSWTSQRLTPDYEHDKYLPAQYFDGTVDSNGNGLFCGALGTLYRYTQRGLSGFVQTHIALGTTTQSAQSGHIESVKGSENWLHAVGDGGGVATTSDQGLTWFTHTDPNYDKVQYAGLHFSSVENGVLFTPEGLQQYYSPFQMTTDTGRKWQVLDIGRTSRLYSSRVGADRNVYVFGDSLAVRSTDGGETWQQYCRYWRSAPPSPGRKVLRTIISDGEFWPDGGSCLLVYEIDSFYDAGSDLRKLAYPVYSIIRSSDHGRTWTDPVYFQEGIYINDLVFINRSLGYAVGNASNLFRTTDGGATWSYVPGLDSVRMTLMFNSTGSIGIASGDYGRIFETRDSGYTWLRVDPQYPLGSGTVNLWKGCFAGDTVAILNSNKGLWRKTFKAGDMTVRGAFEQHSAPRVIVRSVPENKTLIAEVSGFDASTSIQMIAYDLLGRQVADLSERIQEKPIGAIVKVPFESSRLSTGTYMLVVSDGRLTVSTPFIVEH